MRQTPKVSEVQERARGPLSPFHVAPMGVEFGMEMPNFTHIGATIRVQDTQTKIFTEI